MTLACGLYRTLAPVPGYPDVLPAARLVFFHNHSDAGPPVILLPATNDSNRWQFHDAGYLVPDVSVEAVLEPLLAEGVYFLRQHFHLGRDRVVNQHALVQLGYTVAAEPILFFPIADPASNTLSFPDRGLRIGNDVYNLLERVDLRGPYVPDVATGAIDA